MAVMLAVGCAVVQGVADFCGGRSASLAPVIAVGVLSKGAVLPILALGVFVVGGPAHPQDLAWGLLAGVFGMASLVLLYRGLAAGAITVVAPISAVTAALVPFSVGMITAALPPAAAIVGAVFAVVACALVSLGSTGGRRTTRPDVVALAVGSGCGLGLFFVFLHRAGDDAGLWPLAAAHVGALTIGICALLVRHVWPLAAGAQRTRRVYLAFRVPSGTARWATLAGVLDLSANALYQLAAHGAPLSVVAPIAALYPASTVALALAINREPVRRPQLAGLALAATALLLVAV
jgi:drug/metabolite transporter (DMT)-like permease